MWKQENFYLGPDRSELDVLVWSWKINMLCGMVQILDYMSARVSTNYKSSNRIKFKTYYFFNDLGPPGLGGRWAPMHACVHTCTPPHTQVKHALTKWHHQRQIKEKGAPILQGCAKLRFCQIFKKTPWNWENFGPWEGHMCRGCPLPLRSATDHTNFFYKFLKVWYF